MEKIATYGIYLVMMVLVLGSMGFQCNRYVLVKDKQKIGFDYSRLDANGLRNGEGAVDYEFCIPSMSSAEKRILKIEPEVKIMKHSKGRVGCSDRQWLCIISTHQPDWNRTLFAIAQLSYVERIEETFYE